MEKYRITEVKTKSERKKYVSFRHSLYRGDGFYSATAEFTFDMLFSRTTGFAKKCDIRPVYVSDDAGKILVQALLIKNPVDDFAQMSFFEALEHQESAVEALTDYAEAYGREMGCKRLYVGLNGHLSYGVGLSTDMSEPNTFDSCYSKTYYSDYFPRYKQYGLTAYKSAVCDAAKEIPDGGCGGIKVRCIDMKNFEKECRIFGDLCNRTIGNTFLFSPTDEEHFFELLDPMRFFLKSENILFAFRGDTPVGFLFWHPDYCEILPKGRQIPLCEIAAKYLFSKNRIRKIKLNSMGVLPEYRGRATLALIAEFKKSVLDYDEIETNFVWDCNRDSTLLNRAVMKIPARSFRVFETEL